MRDYRHAGSWTTRREKPVEIGPSADMTKTAFVKLKISQDPMGGLSLFARIALLVASDGWHWAVKTESRLKTSVCALMIVTNLPHGGRGQVHMGNVG